MGNFCNFGSILCKPKTALKISVHYKIKFTELLGSSDYFRKGLVCFLVPDKTSQQKNQ